MIHPPRPACTRWYFFVLLASRQAVFPEPPDLPTSDPSSMKDLAYLNKFFYKYRWRLIPGVLFVIISNIFAVLPAPVIRMALDLVTENINTYQLFSGFDRQAIIYDIFGSSLLLFGRAGFGTGFDTRACFCFLCGKLLS